MANSTKRNQCKLATMFTLNFAFFLVELIVGYKTNCMSLVADSFHMLSDVAALIVAFFAVRMSQKQWSKNTYGWARAEVLGALVNSVFLVALCLSIVIESVKRFFDPPELEQPKLILLVGGIGLLMNIVGLCIFHDHGHSHGPTVAPSDAARRTTLTHSNRLTRMVQSNVENEIEMIANEAEPAGHDSGDNADKPPPPPKALSTVWDPVKGKEVPADEICEPNANVKGKSSGQMNIRGVFLHLLADTLGSVIVVASALVVYYFEHWEYKNYVDPCLSIAMVILILISVYPLLVESSLILLQSVPDHIKIDDLERKMIRQVGVIGVHELHVWQLAGDRIVGTAHIKCRDIQEYFQIAQKVLIVFHNAGIHSTTIQPEFCQNENCGNECILSCATIPSANCSEDTCCPPKKDKSPTKLQVP